MKVTVDRIEEGICVCVDEEEKTYNIPLGDFKIEVRPCDVLEIELSGKTLLSAVFLADETEEMRRTAQNLMEKLRNKNRT